MSATAIALSMLLSRCAPDVGPRTITAIVRVESNAHPLAIHDNTTGRSFLPVTVRAATTIAESLIAARHSVDLGLVQVNSGNFKKLGVTPRDMFDPCTNVNAGARILSDAYADAARRLGPGRIALRRAIGAYNSGSIYAGDAYIDRILVAAGLPPDRARILPDLEAPVSAGPAPIVRTIPLQRSATPAPAPVPVRMADPFRSALIVPVIDGADTVLKK